MSERVLLTLRAPLGERIELDGVSADRLANLDEAEIARLRVRLGRRRASLGDFFDVSGGRSDRVRIEGNLRLADGIGAGAAGGEMVIEGAVGNRLGAAMTGGWIDVRGDAGDEAGLAMAGGAIRIVGRAGDRAGANAPGAARGMTGGELIVNGPAGAAAGSRMRRGLVVVAGDVGPDAGRAMIAGTVAVLGNVGPNPGRGSKRGSIVALGSIDVPETYRYACVYQPGYLRMLFVYLRRRYGLTVEDAAMDGRFTRYCGDAGTVGKGEILALVT